MSDRSGRGDERPQSRGVRAAIQQRACTMAGIAGALVLAGCGGGAEPKGRLSATDAFQVALAAKEEGDCATALPAFERLAKIGRGWELAQVYLAECLVEQGSEKDGPGAQADYAEAVRWLMLAVQSNESQAQELLATLTLQGVGVSRDPIEAGKWYLLSQKSAIEGVNEPPEALLAELNAALSATDWEEAQARASAWVPEYQDFNVGALGRRRPEGEEGAGGSRRAPPLGRRP